ncbi:hypothetical protein V490_02328 [Pseudogymnoascus sp. VKM F-3557]|nr:hypothetical protein V490_02328 [Pseudogymnoascus sp. VKM F-3557]
MPLFVAEMDKRAGLAIDFGSWCSWYSFDLTGLLSFQELFGFMEQAKDINGVIESSWSFMSYGTLVGQNRGAPGDVKFPYAGKSRPGGDRRVSTAADEYRRKLRGLVLLRNIGCPFVFLTGKLPPLCQREFEEAMPLQNPLYIRASSHCVNVEYSVVRVKNGWGATEVQNLVESQVAGFAPREKGVIYYNSHMKCKVLAQRLGCHYYHGNPEDSNAHFVAQREAGFQAWLGGETPYIVATAALGMGIDVPKITHVIHLEAPLTIIHYAQEAGRAGKGGERVAAVVVIGDKEWPEEDAAKGSRLELKRRGVNSFIRMKARGSGLEECVVYARDDYVSGVRAKGGTRVGADGVVARGSKGTLAVGMPDVLGVPRRQENIEGWSALGWRSD